MKFWFLISLIVVTSAAWAADVPGQATHPSSSSSAKAAPSSPAGATEDSDGVDPQQLFDAGKQLFDQFAPEEIKNEYEFPSRQDWDRFVARVQEALQGGSLEELAALEPDVRRSLIALRTLPEYSDYVDWLSERLDLIETARDAVASKKAQSPPPPSAESSHPSSSPPGETPPRVEVNTDSTSLPYYSLWLQRLHDRPKPPQADELIPLLKVIFSAEGIPPQLAWLAEVESSLNPDARSPAGARGLFQLMPATAKSLGLSLLPFDERAQPGKNARAAAKLLRKLHERFEDWPLALAAYNIGEGKLATLLKKDQVNTFASVEADLPSETRMYVPKVFATLMVREKSPPSVLLSPTHAPEKKSEGRLDSDKPAPNQSSTRGALTETD